MITFVIIVSGLVGYLSIGRLLDKLLAPTYRRIAAEEYPDWRYASTAHRISSILAWQIGVRYLWFTQVPALIIISNYRKRKKELMENDANPDANTERS